MADAPWSNIKLSRGQVIQRLETLGCKEISKIGPNSSTWQAPTGNYFTISYNCNAEYLEGIEAQVREWVKKSRNK